jgi:hypothetical protein
MGAYIFDFWFAENLPVATRYHRRHGRDGLCLECKRQAFAGRTRCAKHLREHTERQAKYKEAMARKIFVNAASSAEQKTPIGRVSEPLAGGTLFNSTEGGNTN